MQPRAEFASVGDQRVAYQVLGDGPRDLVHTIGLWSQVDVVLEDPSTLRYLTRLSSFNRVILFDCRGSGLSDPRPADGRSIAEHWQEDLLAVLDAAGASAPALMGLTDAGPLLLRFVAAHPERCSRLILFNTSACFTAEPGYPIGFDREQRQRFLEFIRKAWGNEGWPDWFSPSVASNEPLRRWVAKWCRIQASPGTAVANVRDVFAIDARAALAEIRVPTLVMTRTGHRMLPVPHGRYIAEHLHDARFVELPGADGMPMWETTDEILDRVEEFLTGSRHGEPDRVLVTLMSTDIVDSTRRAAELGDTAWRSLLDRHDRAVREQVALHLGRLVDFAGDGTLAAFDSPDRAIECAVGLRRALEELGLRVRAGLHLATVELREDGRLGGLGVHIAARLMALAGPDEVLVSHTLHGVLIGSRYAFEERGAHELKGVPGTWSVYELRTGASPG